MMKLHFDVSGEDFTRAGEASGKVKATLKQLGYDPNTVRRVAIALYEGEINLVIHAGGGTIDVEMDPAVIHITLSDHGPGIADVEKAMREGYSTASDDVRMMGFGAGMGLSNMARNSDRFHIESQVGVGTEITMGFDL